MIRLAIAILLALPSAAFAQAIRADALDGSALEARVGADDAFVAELDYSRSVRFAIIDGTLDLPWDSLDVHDWRARVGLTVPMTVAGRWHVIPRVAPTLRVSANETAHLVGLGIDFGIVAGYYAPRWLVAAELGVDAELITHVTPTDEFRMKVFDATAGWYDALGGVVRYGLVLGTTAGRNDLALRVGLVRMTDGDPPTLPLYATLGYARRW
jgi:hypothetical protein